MHLRKFAWIYIVLLVAIGISLWMLQRNYISEPFTIEIPKKIWTYWNSEEIPPFVVRCVKNWKRQNQEYEVTVIQPKTMETYIPSSVIPVTFKELTPQQQADWIRLYLLKEYGGFWLDASIVLTQSLSWIQKKGVPTYGFYIQGFTKDPQYPVLENWFIASVPQAPFIQAWYKEFHFVCTEFGNNGNKYNEYLKNKYGDTVYQQLLQNIQGPDYLTMHMAAQKIMQIDKVPPYACDIAEEGPYYILVKKAGWDANRFAEEMSKPYTDTFVPPIIKLRGLERNAMIHYLTTHTPDKDSIYTRFLQD